MAKKPSLFDILKNVSSTNDNRWVEYQSVYNSYMINKFLSMNPDTVLFANEMNKTKLPPKEQYEFYLYAIPNKFRRFNYVKSKKDDRLDLICKHYKVNKERGKEYLETLTDQQYKAIEDSYDEGGLTK